MIFETGIDVACEASACHCLATEKPAQTGNPQNFLVNLADQQIFLVEKRSILHLFLAPFVPVSVRF
jgi:hypothetical protein